MDISIRPCGQAASSKIDFHLSGQAAFCIYSIQMFYLFCKPYVRVNNLMISLSNLSSVLSCLLYTSDAADEL